MVYGSLVDIWSVQNASLLIICNFHGEIYGKSTSKNDRFTLIERNCQMI